MKSIRLGLNNVGVFAISILLWTFWASAEVHAQEVVLGEQEEAIDLDALDEEESSAGAGALTSGRTLIPVTSSMVEIERQPSLMLAALAVLIPVACMLLPNRRGAKRRVRRSPAGGGRS